MNDVIKCNYDANELLLTIFTQFHDRIIGGFECFYGTRNYKAPLENYKLYPENFKIAGIDVLLFHDTNKTVLNEISEDEFGW